MRPQSQEERTVARPGDWRQCIAAGDGDEQTLGARHDLVSNTQSALIGKPDLSSHLAAFICALSAGFCTILAMLVLVGCAFSRARFADFNAQRAKMRCEFAAA
jgi:hypothetical protein